MTYEKKQVHNIETGEITYEDMTPEEIAQRDAQRAESEVEAAMPPPKSELDELRELIAEQARQIAALQEKVK